MCPAFQPVRLAQSYEASGAAAVSVLTEENFFLGSLDDLAQVKRATKKLPVLRKDFIIDRYQIYEARVYGADAVLLIVAALTGTILTSYIKEAQALGMDALVEVHNETELATALDAGAEIIGINNRDLRTFHVDLETTFRLRRKIPKDKVVVAESGIKTRDDLKRLAPKSASTRLLIGEALVTTANPGAVLRSYAEAPMVPVKICGITNLNDALICQKVRHLRPGFYFRPFPPPSYGRTSYADYQPALAFNP